MGFPRIHCSQEKVKWHLKRWISDGRRDSGGRAWMAAAACRSITRALRMTLTNADEFPDGIVKLNPGEGRELIFKSLPNYTAEAGEYEFLGLSFMRISYEGHGWGLSEQVDFKPIATRIKIDQDYPATVEEREQWELEHRKLMLDRSVEPREKFSEDGLYRAVLLDSSVSRSLQLRVFRRGDVAPKENIKMPMESGHGQQLDGKVRWLWEGSAPTPVNQHSSELIDGTQQFIKPGMPAPRSGRWLPRFGQGRAVSADDEAGIVEVRRGQTMPGLNTFGGDAGWEWIGH